MPRDWFLQDLNLVFVAFIVMRRRLRSAVLASGRSRPVAAGGLESDSL